MSIPGIKSLRQESERRRRWTPARITFLFLGVLFVLYVALGFLVAPVVARSQLQKRLTDLSGRAVAIQKVTVNPLTLSVEVLGLSIAEPSGGEFAGWQRLFINFTASSIPAHEWRFKDIDLTGLRGQLFVDAEGKLSVSDILDRLKTKGGQGTPPTPGAKAKAWPISIDRLHLNSGELRYEDLSLATPFKTAAGPIDVTVFRLHTTADRLADGGFTATTGDGESFAWRGLISLAPLSSSGEVELIDIPLAKYAPFYQNALGVDVTGGKLSTKIRYDVKVTDGRIGAQLSDGASTLSGLQLTERGGKGPVVSLDRIAVTGISGSTIDNAFKIASVTLGKGQIALTRDGTGINAQHWMPRSAPKPAAPGDTASAPFSVAVDELALDDVSIQLLDTSGPRPAELRLDALATTVRNFNSSSLGNALPLTFSSKVQQEGTVEADGQVSLSPFSFKGKLAASHIPLASFSPWVEALAPYQVAKGALSVNAEVDASFPTDVRPVIGAKASVKISDLAVNDLAEKQPLAGFQALHLRGVEFVSLPAQRLVINEVALESPVVNAVIRKDRTINLIPGKKVEDVDKPEPVAPRKPLPFSVAVDRVSITAGLLEFRDQSIQPEVKASLRDFGGTVEGLSSEEIARARVDLSGKVEGASKIAISGQINPLSDKTFTDLVVKMQGMDLSPLAPYVGKYAGKELTRGSANLDVNLHLSSQTLDSANVLILDQFTLGNVTNSPDATKLPVSLALALLRDRQGKVKVDLPIQGRLDDPEFRIGRVIARIIGNILTKAATSPFSLIGSMFGGGRGGDELGFQTFAPGEAGLDTEDVKKLVVVANALRERPGLNLDVTGSYDPVQDTNALKERILRERLKAALAEEMRAASPGAAVPDASSLEITPEGEARLLGKLFTLDASELPATPQAAAAPLRGEKPAPVSKSWLQRLGEFFRGSSDNTSSVRASGPPTHRGDSAAAAAAKALPPVDEMRRSVLERIPVDPTALRELASKRATAARAFLVNEGKAPADHIFIAPVVVEGAKVRLDLK